METIESFYWEYVISSLVDRSMHSDPLGGRAKVVDGYFFEYVGSILEFPYARMLIWDNICK